MGTFRQVGHKMPTSPDAEEPPEIPTELDQSFDLKALYKATSVPGPGMRLTTDPPPRHMWAGPVAAGSHPGGPVGVMAGALPVFTDGCQSAAVIDCVGSARRPVLLLWAGATSLEPVHRVVGALIERLWLVCSVEDEEEVRSLPGGAPVMTVPALIPSGIRSDALKQLREVRAHFERVVIRTTATDGLLMVDGSLLTLGSEPVSRTIGVSKSCRTRYLEDERPLVQLPEGHTSRSFVLSRRSVLEADRVSAYLRLHPPAGDDWTHGLIRVEAYSEDDLAAGVAAAFATRQHPGSQDPRRDCQLIGTYIVEEMLKSRRPTFL